MRAKLWPNNMKVSVWGLAHCTDRKQRIADMWTLRKMQHKIRNQNCAFPVEGTPVRDRTELRFTHNIFQFGICNLDRCRVQNPRIIESNLLGNTKQVSLVQCPRNTLAPQDLDNSLVTKMDLKP